MDIVIGVVFLLLVLFLVGRRMPAGRWPAIIAGTLVVILAVVLAERAGLWPRSWTVR